MACVLLGTDSLVILARKEERNEKVYKNEHLGYTYIFRPEAATIAKQPTPDAASFALSLC